MGSKKRITLRLSILTVYAITFIILMSTFIVAGSINFTNSMAHVAGDLMSGASNLVLHELEREISPAKTLSSLTQTLLVEGLVNDENMIDYNVAVAKIFRGDQIPGAVRISGWGDTEGNSVATFREDDGSYSTGITTIDADGFHHVYLSHDLTGTIIKKQNLAEKYDPRLRPWYIAAENAKHFVWTDIFLSYPYKNPSISASTPIYNKSGKFLGVFEIEIKLVELADFLKTLKIGEEGVAFIVNGKDELVAFPGMQKWMGLDIETPERKLIELRETDKPWLENSLMKHKENGLDQFTYDYNGVRYLANFREIEEFKDYGWKVGIVVPEKDFIGLLKRKNLIVVFIGLSILLLGIICAMIFSKRIAASMKFLVEETDRIKNFNLEGGKVGESVITEVDTLANAIYSMKMNLRAFQKYMPASLVRQLILSGEDVQIGGAKKMLTIFFSDIAGFTTITEKMDPQELMTHLCEYFDNLSKIITETGGTIDKFIGDSIMAFWGAPILDSDHCQHACRAALHCKERIDELNSRWMSEGKPPLNTRIGIHMGEVIVGNIGSSDRINYTVVGDSVNLANRLEQLNKSYQTTIIVSEEVVKCVGTHFEFRFLDNIPVKGKTGSYNIYELVAEKSSSAKF